MEEDTQIKNHIHSQHNPIRFQSVVWAPEKNGSGKARFAVEPMIYVPGGGLDNVDPMVQGNEFVVMMINYIRIKELMGYEHVGKSSSELAEMFKNGLWKK